MQGSVVYKVGRKGTRLDLLLCKSLKKFKKVDKAVSSTTFTVLNRHTWYLTEENTSLPLFNTKISLKTRTELALSIFLQQIPSEALEIRKPAVEDFVGGRSGVLFDLLEIPMDFLKEDDWSQAPEYTAIETALKNLTPMPYNQLFRMGVIIKGRSSQHRQNLKPT